MTLSDEIKEYGGQKIDTPEDFEMALEKIMHWKELIEIEENKISEYFDRHPEELWKELG